MSSFRSLFSSFDFTAAARFFAAAFFIFSFSFSFAFATCRQFGLFGLRLPLVLPVASCNPPGVSPLPQHSLQPPCCLLATSVQPCLQPYFILAAFVRPPCSLLAASRVIATGLALHCFAFPGFLGSTAAVPTLCVDVQFITKSASTFGVDALLVTKMRVNVLRWRAFRHNMRVNVWR